MGDLAEEAALEGLLSRVTWMWVRELMALSLSPCTQPGAQLGGFIWPHACWLLGGGMFSWSLESRERAVSWGWRREPGVEW